MAAFSSQSLKFGSFRLDRGQRLLFRGSEIVPLAPRLYDTLLALVESDGGVADKEDLLRRVWQDAFVEEGSLTRNVSTLRKILGEGPRDNKYIVTVPKRGYRFAATLTASRGLDQQEAAAHTIWSGPAPAQTSTEEVNSGSLDMLLLRTLSLRNLHGYEIAQFIQQSSDDELLVEEGSLYPALERLELNGWIDGVWIVTSNNRRVRIYNITASGREQLATETRKYAKLTLAIARVMGAK